MKRFISMAAALVLMAAPAFASEHGHHEGGHAGVAAEHHGHHGPVADKVIAEQRKALAKNTKGKGFGPQSPRDIDAPAGKNHRLFSAAPASTEMSLCNIHFHKNAEHKARDFSIYAGNGNGEGYQSGYRYDTAGLSKAELAPSQHKVCDTPHSSLKSGDTIEVHYVYSTAQVNPGPTLGSCLSKAINNPQLRVETQVFVLVNDKHALNFKKLAKFAKNKSGRYQASGIPANTGTPVEYAGSTTGPGYNEKGSPFQVTWSVRPQVAKVNIASVGKWCEKNV
ncbi:MAG: delta-class carbonic anhydrase, partial [Mariprofundaceae bacterium]|nr:delta-class carbonic anhydrase [Mariprofundaceae bacterium]